LEPEGESTTPLPALITHAEQIDASRMHLVCPRQGCQRTYVSCTSEERGAWRYVSALGIEGNNTQLYCGLCFAYYETKMANIKRLQQGQNGMYY
jgi:hypothetical protein